MQIVKVRRMALMNQLERNRTKHQAAYDRAVKVFAEKRVQRLRKMLANAKAGKKYEPFLNMVEPMNQVDAYNNAIAMLRVSVDADIELTQVEFAQYWQDKWGWSEQFASSTLNYANAKVGGQAARRRR